MKKDAKLIISILALLASLIFVAWYSKYGANSTITSTSINKYYKIYLITIDNKDQFWYQINQGAMDMASILGVTYIWEAPDSKNTEQQIEILNRAVRAGANAILIAANDPVLLSGPIEDAKARGVKIIYVDTPAYEEAITTLSTDNYHAGVTAARAMIAELEARGIDSGQIGIISVNKITDSTMRREEGFRDTINTDGRFEILETQYRNGDPAASEEAAAEIIVNNSKLVGIFGTNEGSSVGVGNAILDENRRILGIGFDKSDAILQLLREGGLFEVIVQNPYTMGYLGMAQAWAALNGRDTGPEILNTGVSILRRR